MEKAIDYLVSRFAVICLTFIGIGILSYLTGRPWDTAAIIYIIIWCGLFHGRIIEEYMRRGRNRSHGSQS
jgi:hypothetical protein